MRPLLFAAPFVLASALCAQQVTIPADTPLRIALDQDLRLTHPGEPFRAHLAAPIYLGERLVLPAGTPVHGHIAHLNAIPKLQRAAVMAKGDFTPFKNADLRFDSITLPSGTSLSIATASAELSGEPLRMGTSGNKQSRMQQIKDMIRERKEEALATFKHESKPQVLKRRAVLSLPYHPQWIATGTRYDAALTEPVSLQLRPQAPIEHSALTMPNNATVHARFTDTISSLASHPGDPVTAIVTEPLLDAENKLIIPQGTLLHGEVQRATPSRWFGRGGQLRFRFTSVELPQSFSAPHPLSGQIVAAEGPADARLKMDSEGGTRSVPAKNRLLAPLTLGPLAANSTHGENGPTGHHGALAGGFGITGRLISLGLRATPASPVLSYYALSQSIYSRWIARGKNVTFAKNSRIEVSFGAR